MRKRCLFLNNISEKCGIYQYGKRLCNILKNSQDNIYMYVEVSSMEEYEETLKNIEYDCIIYNYSAAYFDWLTNETMKKDKKNICIYHEFDINLKFDVYVNTDSTYSEHDIWYSLPRPLFENNNNINSNNNEIPVIGSFGLALPQKGFEHIIKMVNKEFDKAIIKLHIPNSQFGDPDSDISNQIINRCKQIKRKSKVDLIITNNFLTDQQVLDFLNTNNINVFMYDNMSGRGLSSVIDYAISANSPIGISDSNVFRHIYDDSICLYRNSIREIMEMGTDYIDGFKKLWSNRKLIEKMDYIIGTNI